MESDRARELEQSELWRELVQDLQGDIESYKEKLVFEQDREKILRLQEKIFTIREVINKPNELSERSTVSE